MKKTANRSWARTGGGLLVVALMTAGLFGCGDETDSDADATETATEETTEEPTPEEPTAEAETKSVFELEVGDCIAEAEQGIVDQVGIVPCDEPHEAEVYFTEDMTDSSFPGEDAVLEFVQDECIPAFEEFVGADFATSELDIFPLTPTEQTWDSGDREVICMVTEVSGEPKTGTAEGAAR